MRNWFLQFAILILSIIIALAGFEVILRIINYDPLKDLKDGREIMIRPSHHSDIKYELIPGVKSRAWGTDVEINPHGHRGRIGATGKFPGYRILIFGDSITFGNYLPVEATYPDKLHNILAGCDSNYQVLNFGVGGYDILQEIALIEQIGLAYEPDLVIIGFCLNDVGIMSINLEYIDRLTKYQQKAIFRLRIACFLAEKIDRILIGNWQREKNNPEVFQRDYQERISPIGAEEHELRRLMKSPSGGYPSSMYDNKFRIGRLRYAFDRLSRLSGQNNFQVVVLIFPWLATEKTGEYPHNKAHRIVALEARRAGFDVIDLLPEFMEVGMETLKVSKNDPIHPNAQGHLIAAEKAARYICKQ